ncbi:MAG: hypothetical protein A2096_02680 [Spirochaetes bacterium GWF1_41_5]|nr:MAG: hypothetical protein A2096_02680 [Spirochaetes bacterium GWF1_41_5]
MNIAPKRFNNIVFVLDKFNPFIVLLSIIGLALEYTPLKELVQPFNTAFDIVFVLDFITRLICFPVRSYFFRAYGWVDMLASIPGLFVMISFSPGLMRIFKVLRIGRFFKIVRILRFLRIFSFLKKMKDDSPWIQERIMKIGIAVVLTMVISIGFVDVKLKNIMVEREQEYFSSAYRKCGVFQEFITASKSILMYNSWGEYFDVTKNAPAQQAFYDNIHAVNDVYEIKLEDHVNVLVFLPAIQKKHDQIIGVLVITVIILLLLLVFYIGYLLAADVRIFNLINDSIDADDYILLLSEGGPLADPDGKFRMEKDEEETVSLLKMINKLIIEKNISIPQAGTEPGMNSGEQIDFVGKSIKKKEALLDIHDLYRELEEVEGALQNIKTAEQKAELSEDILSVVPDQEPLSAFKDGLDSIDDLPETALQTEDSLSESLDLNIDDLPETSGMEENTMAADSEAVREIVRTELDKFLIRLNREFSDEAGFVKKTAVEAVRITAKSIAAYLKKQGM